MSESIKWVTFDPKKKKEVKHREWDSFTSQISFDGSDRSQIDELNSNPASTTRTSQEEKLYQNSPPPGDSNTKLESREDEPKLSVMHISTLLNPDT